MIKSPQVDSVFIEFSAQISSITQSTSSFSASGSGTGYSSGAYGWNWWFWGSRTNWNSQTSVAQQSSSSYGGQEQTSFAMDVKVHVVQDSMPAGLAKILSVLEDAFVLKSFN